MNVLQEKISGIEISPNEKSKRIINIKIKEEKNVILNPKDLAKEERVKKEREKDRLIIHGKE